MATSDKVPEGERTPEQWFGVRVRREREKRGWTQSELARRMEDFGTKLHVSAIAKIEAGSRAVRLNEASSVSRVLDVDLSELVRAPTAEFREAAKKMQDALALHRDARLLEHEAREMMQTLGADFGNATERVAMHPSHNLYQVLKGLDEFRGVGGSSDG